MLKKGIICSLFPTHAVVLEQGGAFHHIQLKDQMELGQAILFTSEDTLPSTKRSLVSIKPLMTMAAALLLFILPMWYVNAQPSAIVSLDINPSIELLLSNKGTIKNVIAKNEDGEPFCISNLKGKSLEEALFSLHGELVTQGFLQDTTYMLVSFADLRRNRLTLAETLPAYLANSFQDAAIIYLPSNKSTYSLAGKDHMSLGRYQASQLLDLLEEEIDYKTIDIPSLIYYLQQNELLPTSVSILPEVEDDWDDDTDSDDDSDLDNDSDDDSNSDNDNDWDDNDSDSDNDDDSDDNDSSSNVDDDSDDNDSDSDVDDDSDNNDSDSDDDDDSDNNDSDSDDDDDSDNNDSDSDDDDDSDDNDSDDDDSDD